MPCGREPSESPPLRPVERGVVNDVFLAVLTRAMADFLPRRSSKGASTQLALGTIVDTRGDAGEDLSESLGTFLGYFVAVWPAIGASA